MTGTSFRKAECQGRSWNADQQLTQTVLKATDLCKDKPVGGDSKQDADLEQWLQLPGVTFGRLNAPKQIVSLL
jgi:hypothetical protein